MSATQENTNKPSQAPKLNFDEPYTNVTDGQAALLPEPRAIVFADTAIHVTATISKILESESGFETSRAVSLKGFNMEAYLKKYRTRYRRAKK